MIVSLPAQGAQYDADARRRAGLRRASPASSLWVFHSIPHPGEFGYDTWPPDAYKKSAAACHNWSEFTVDEQNGIAFIPFGSPRFDFYGGDRPGNNLFGNSLVALDARTGRRLWHFQTRASRPVGLRPAAGAEAADHPPERPQHRRRRAGDQARVPVRVRARDRPSDLADRGAAGAASRTSRVSGRRRRSRSRPSRRRSRDSRSPRRTSTRICRRPSAQALVERFKTLRNEGLFTPPSFEGSIQLPGHNGGANFGSVRGRSDARRDVRRRRRALPTVIRIALPGQARARRRRARRRPGRARSITPEQKAKMIAEAQALVDAAKGAGAVPVALRVHEHQQPEHERHRAAVVGDHGVRPEHRRHQVAHTCRQVNAPPELGHPGRTPARTSRAADRS